MRKRITLLLFLSLFSSIKLWAGDQNIPLKIKGISDSFVEGLVGESEFKNNYRLVESKGDCSSFWGCYITYKFLPGEKYGGSTYLFYYSSSDKKVGIANNNIPIILPSCEKDKNKCNFKLTPDDLEKIAQSEHLGLGRLVMYNDSIVAEMSHCDLNTTEGRRKILVDLQTGLTVWDGPNSECQGIT